MEAVIGIDHIKDQKKERERCNLWVHYLYHYCAWLGCDDGWHRLYLPNGFYVEYERMVPKGKKWLYLKNKAHPDTILRKVKLPVSADRRNTMRLIVKWIDVWNPIKKERD